MSLRGGDGHGPGGGDGEEGRADGAAGPPGGGDAEDAATRKRRAIQAILRDRSLTEKERSLRIQGLMDGSSVRAAAAARAMGNASAGGTCVPVGGAAAGVGSLFGGGPFAASGVPPFAAAAGGGAADAPEGVPCVHYTRKCSVVAPCCGRVFGCRVCHDEMSPGCGPMDRFAVREVVCRECNTRQDSKTNSCFKCGVTFAEYHCPKCNIWMELSKKPFHCDQCGFCRVGGRDKFRHCPRCCMCIATSTFDTHNCMTDKYKNNCPVCREDMFSSRQSPQDLPCGHTIHAHCFRNLLATHDYRCPICKKTVVDRASMSAAWAARARDIAMQPMPEDLARVVNILCNDCEAKSENRNWHFLGVQCPACSSFNTVVESLVSENAISGSR